MVDGEVPGINSDLLDLWFIQHFLPHAPAGQSILLLLDCLSSHYNSSVINKAAEEKLIIFVYPHICHINPDFR